MANKENIRKWVDALRSGKYKQAKERLRDKNSYCCLGVACDVSGVGKWQKDFWNSWEYAVYEAPGDVNDLDLPKGVQKWLGIRLANPKFKRVPASQLNDEMGKTFEEIADYIEKKYLK